jgi:hypothetical protein
VNKSFKDHLEQQYSKWLLAVGHVLTLLGEEAQHITGMQVVEDQGNHLPTSNVYLI